MDFETTGEPEKATPSTDPKAPQARICETGWTDIRVDDCGGVLVGQPQSMLINPGVPIPPVTRAIHHISDDDVAGCPDASASFIELMKGRPDYFCAHNADFERHFFGGGAIPFICTYKVALRVWPEAEAHNLQFLRYALALDIDQEVGLPAHRAGPDAYVGAALMAAILQHPECPDFDTMARWSNGPALLPRVTFGKHKGEKWEDTPTSYLEWVAFKSDLNRDAKANAKHHLKQRGIR